jgi:hypothetical protein
LKKVLEKGFSLFRCLVRELWGRVVPFTGNFERKRKEGSRNGPFPEPSFHFFSKIPVNGTTLPQSSLTRHLKREKPFSRTFFNP